MRRLKTVRRPPIYPKTPGHLPCSSLTHPLPLSSRRPSVSFGGFGLSRTLIAEHVWNYDFDNATNVIDVHIRNLRRKVDEPFGEKLIQTVRGSGYRISAPHEDEH